MKIVALPTSLDFKTYEQVFDEVATTPDGNVLFDGRHHVAGYSPPAMREDTAVPVIELLHLNKRRDINPIGNSNLIAIQASLSIAGKDRDS